MEFTERPAGKAVVLAPGGRVDTATADQFRDRVLALVTACAAEKRPVVLDFSAVDYISSAGLRVLMLAAKQARTSGVTVVVAALQPVVLEIFQISRFDKVIACHPGVTEALAAAGAGGG